VITRLNGRLLESNPDVVVEVGGIGLAVQVPERDRARLPEPGGEVVLWTHLAVREDGWSLYGFLDRDDRELFRLLIGVTGIGPRLAVGILGAAAATEVAAWILARDQRALVALPGVGKRTAARLVTELVDKLPPALLAARPQPAPAGEAAVAGPDPQREVAEQMLAGMGLPAARAGRLLDEARERDPSVSEDPVRWVREALRLL